MMRSPDCHCYRYPCNKECPACLGVIREEGRAEERAAIVDWLRSEAADQRRAWGKGSEVVRLLDNVADAIEQGLHVKADGESK